MSRRARIRAPGAPWRVVFDGQSLNNVPGGANTPQTFPAKLMSGRRIPWTSVAVNGASWTVLATGGTAAGGATVAPAAERLHPLAGYSDATILVMNGGTQDIFDGDSGQQLYDEEVAYAEAARAAGFSHVIALTLVGNGVNTSDQNDARLEHNAILLADPAGAFDAVVDVDVPPIDDWTNPTYYLALDQTHWLAPATTIVANLVAPALDAILLA